MSRVKRGKISLKRRRNVLKQVKGYRFARSKKERSAKDAILHAGAYAFAHRRDKKADRRASWAVAINAGVRPLGMSYSKLIDKLKKKNIIIDRKILALLAEKNPATFERIVKSL